MLDFIYSVLHILDKLEKWEANMSSFFAGMTQHPPDKIFGVKMAYNQDTSERKVDLSIGAYRDDHGKPVILSCVKQAEEKILQEGKLFKEYVPQSGYLPFRKYSQSLIFGKEDPTIATIQSLSGTGALTLAGHMIQRYFPSGTTIYLPVPTWGNHQRVFKDAGIPIQSYRCFSYQQLNLDIEGMIEDMNQAKEGSVFLFHACANNPTGVDPSPTQWQRILTIVQAKHLFPIFDCAYQGFGSGDILKDAYAIRLFADANVEFCVCQSYAKNMGLYGERIGALHIKGKDAVQVEAMRSHVDMIVRGMYSNPPIHGAYIVSTVLSTPTLYQLWLQEVEGMAKRIHQMRQLLYDGLVKRNTPGDWQHILDQIGMFTFTGLNKEQVKRMKDEYHIYMLENGRISMPGLNVHNVDYVAQAIHHIVQQSARL